MDLTPPSVDGRTGLTAAEVVRRRAAVGRNTLPRAERRGALRRLLGVVREPMIVLLVAATAIYIAFGDTAEAIALGASLLVIIGITLLQERRTERALDALRELASPHARVLRDGAWTDVDASELVPGDIIQIAEGDRVPADAILRAGTPATVDESLLTGESVPVVRVPDATATELGRPGVAGAAVFAATLVTAGNAVAEVVATGARAEVGQIGAALGTIELARAPLQREIAAVVRKVAAIAIGLCALLAAIFLAIGHGWVEAGLAAITLAMAILPEELPLVLTVFLTLGARRIARHRVLARRAAAIETLGAVTVLCVDKTGTLTQNRMAIRRIITSIDHRVDAGADALPEAVHEAIEYGLLACPQQAVDPMDRAFATLAARTLDHTEHLHPRWRWISEYPLSPQLLAVTHVWRDGARRVVATKGAPEAIIDLCHLDASAAALWRARAEAMATDGLRVLGIARASRSHGAMAPAQPHDFAFELIGMVGLADPLRDDTAATIATCRHAGVRVVMITGDHPATARAIGRAAGLAADAVITGPELEAMSATQLAAALTRTDVIARATPAHKLRIVQALRAAGEVVGMTGDGVNDAPALTAADVGIAMGRGTDVAREAAGLVLLDDSLAATAASIRTGRTIYDNLRKVGVYLLAVHLPIAGLALLPPLLGWPVLLAPIHVVFLELVIDPTCSIVFELEPPEADVMHRPPRGRADHLFEPRRIGTAIVLGLAALAGPLAVMATAEHVGCAPAMVRTLGFVALIAADLSLVFAVRGRGRRADAERNPSLRWMVGIVGLLTAATVLVPPLAGLFGFASDARGWIAAAAAIGAGGVLLVARLALHRRHDEPVVVGEPAHDVERGHDADDLAVAVDHR